MRLKRFVLALKAHPGVPVASGMTVLGFIAGAEGEHWIRSGLIGAGIMSMFWIPVLWTAWQNSKENTHGN